jgi:CheY-like chemotaxis protein
MVYGLVKQSGGHAKIYSELGHGSTIRLYLPRALAPEDALPIPVQGEATGGEEMILVVEDDDAVRETVTALLRGLGYRVLEARHAAAAFALIDAGTPVDLLFTDVVMPGPLRSPDLARAARERLPGLAVLFTSGYTENAIVHGGRLDPGVELLSKPYAREALALKVRQVLDARRPVKAVSPPADPEVVEGKPTILLVEDDGLVRFSTVAMLEDLGCEVIEASDAESALQRLEAGGVEVLITDRGLPGMSGDDLARVVARRDPGIGVIFATGAARIDADPAVPGAVNLAKPYSMADLRKAVDRALAGADGREKAGT